MRMQRRQFLRALLGMGIGSTAARLAGPALLLRSGPARAAGAEPVLVTLFLRGGADALSLVVPHGDPAYAAARRTTALERRDLHDLDGFFGLHPELGPLARFYRDGRLAVVHACGSPDPTKSHARSQAYLETAVPGDPTVAVGWLNRFAQAASLSDSWALVGLGRTTPRSMAGPGPHLALPSVAGFGAVGTRSEERVRAIAELGEATGGAYGQAARNAVQALDAIASVEVRPRVAYPATPTAASLRDVAGLIRARIGVRVVAVDMGGWDTHHAAPARIASRAHELAGALAAFADDLGGELDRTLVLVMSEFGRRVAQNEAAGFEHGRGGMMLALGGNVRGGRVLLRGGRWPGLAREHLLDGLDLAVTTDFRDVFAEVLDRHMGLRRLAPVFPGFSVASSRYPGILG